MFFAITGINKDVAKIKSIVDLLIEFGADSLETYDETSLYAWAVRYLEADISEQVVKALLELRVPIKTGWDNTWRYICPKLDNLTDKQKNAIKMIAEYQPAAIIDAWWVGYILERKEYGKLLEGKELLEARELLSDVVRVLIKKGHMYKSALSKQLKYANSTWGNSIVEELLGLQMIQ